MAAPPSKTLKDLSGTWVMNKTLSTDTDAILTLQGISWFMRKAISLATVTLNVTQVQSDPAEITIDQVATGGITGTTEHRILDWDVREHKDGIFGQCKGKSRYVRIADLEPGQGKEEAEFLGEGWLDEGGEFIQSLVESVGNGWTANQIWGFEEIREGERRWVRHVIVKKGADMKTAKLVYDFIKD